MRQITLEILDGGAENLDYQVTFSKFRYRSKSYFCPTSFVVVLLFMSGEKHDDSILRSREFDPEHYKYFCYNIKKSVSKRPMPQP
jgi:hypothetical protein